MSMKTNLRITLFLSLMIFGISGLSNAVVNDIPDPQQFISVGGKSERPLGSSYVVPYFNQKGKKITNSLDRKSQVLMHHEGIENKMPTKREYISTTYDRFDFRTTESVSKATSGVLGGIKQENLGDFMFKYHNTSETSENELSIDSVWSETKFLPLQLSFFYRG
ncbi:MAG: hypothetical protein AB8G05_13640 [Oligoflexales bacterium]